MTDEFNDAQAAQAWLDGLASAITAHDASALAALLEPGGFWRDLVSLSWDIRQRRADAIPDAFIAEATAVGMRDLRLSERFPAPRQVTRSLRDVLEVFFDFTTNAGEGVGVARLVRDGERWVAWIVLTTLQALTPPNDVTPIDPEEEQRDPRDLWIDRRQEAIAHEHDPEVLIIGAGQGGLSLGARLTQLGVDALLIERNPRVGDNWRNRYDSLALHTPSASSRLPYLPYPETFPMWIPKDKLADWFEFYASAMELNVWTGSEAQGARYDDEAERWTVTVARPDGSTVELHPAHLVLATGGGFGNIPFVPSIPGLEEFTGDVVHTKHYSSGKAWAGKRAMVIGASTSGHDVAYDLARHGAEVTMVQRGPVTIVSPRMANLTVAHYFHGLPIEEADLIGASGFLEPVLEKVLQAVTKVAIEHDRELIEAVERRGLKTFQGENDTGWLLRSLKEGGGYYINVGASDAIAAGEIDILDAARLAGFEAGGARLEDGSVIPLDLVVLATGYQEPKEDLRPIVGDEVAERVGTVFRFDDESEHTHVWRPTPQRGLWIMGGGLGQVRPYSKYLALQLGAALRGLHPDYQEHEPSANEVAPKSSLNTP